MLQISSCYCFVFLDLNEVKDRQVPKNEAGTLSWVENEGAHRQSVLAKQ